MKNKKGQVVLYIYFLITAFVIIIIAAVLAPMGVLFNSALYEAGEGILEDSREYTDQISDVNVSRALNDTITAALDAGENNIEVNAAIFQYSWVLVLVLTAVVVFLHTRRLIEVGGGGFV